MPLLDLANHEAGCMHEWTSSASTGTAALLAGQPVAAGEQIFVDSLRELLHEDLVLRRWKRIVDAPSHRRLSTSKCVHLPRLPNEDLKIRVDRHGIFVGGQILSMCRSWKQRTSGESGHCFAATHSRCWQPQGSCWREEHQ